MKKDDKIIYRIAAFIFGAAAIVHLIRVVMGLSLKLGNWEAPMWLSILAVVVAGYLSIRLFRH
ncbi:hypothetical protein J4443_02085 [Candidatus Woesearchaeota archaeon]|nr:hypothetical protein [Candidatus Woesearchaeota archaeon]